MTEIAIDRMVEIAKVKQRIRLILLEKKTMYKNTLQRRVGWGLTDEEFEFAVQKLKNELFVTITDGQRGAPVVTLNQAFDGLKLENL
jgi:hypothetical protein